MATYYSLGLPGGPEPIPFVLALYFAAAAGLRRVAMAGAAACVVLTQGVVVLLGERIVWSEVAAVAGALAVVVLLGELTRVRRARVREKAAYEERSRIARELHDSVTHHLAVISVQANAALLGRDIRPEVALTAIKEASKTASRELREALGALRDPECAPRIGALVANVRAAGVDVRLNDNRNGDLDADLDDDVPEVGWAGYRIVQEALTNAVRHAPGAEVDVRVERREGKVAIAVDSGHGLRGMRKRAESAGGTCVAGPSEDGFAVRVELPR
ncbi:Signal transduction histidine kinase [Amycolatopsis xylanica]|uniref:histidine kinase n=2 Tax=Amycolatopsis xylanica TaxID=589385 RepID=A0A1H3CJ92_9PSEU|nr:Signal transduction histidine kinase [Amycolatopsis xylanica]